MAHDCPSSGSSSCWRKGEIAVWGVDSGVPCYNNVTNGGGAYILNKCTEVEGTNQVGLGVKKVEVQGTNSSGTGSFLHVNWVWELGWLHPLGFRFSISGLF